MRVNRLEIPVPDVAVAVDWWRALLPDAVVVGDAVVDAGGLELRFVTGDARGFGQMFVRVAPERLARLADRHGVQPLTAGDGSRYVELQAPGSVTVRVFSEPEEEAYAE